MKAIEIFLLCTMIVGCASKKHSYYLNNVKGDHHHQVSNLKNLNGTVRSIWWTTDPMESCFEDAKPTDKIVTTEPHDMKFVFNYIYYNHSSLDAKRMINDRYNGQKETIIDFTENLKIHYDIAYCENTIEKFFKDEELYVVSYRVTKIENN